MADNIFANVFPPFLNPDIVVGVKITFDRDVTNCAYAATGRDFLDRIRADRDRSTPTACW